MSPVRDRKDVLATTRQSLHPATCLTWEIPFGRGQRGTSRDFEGMPPVQRKQPTMTYRTEHNLPHRVQHIAVSSTCADDLLQEWERTDHQHLVRTDSLDKPRSQLAECLFIAVRPADEVVPHVCVEKPELHRPR